MFASNQPIRYFFALGALVLHLSELRAQDDSATAEPPSVRLAALIKQLGGPTYAERHHATLELERMGTAAREHLETATRSQDPEIRSRAASLLRKLKVQDLWRPSLVTLHWKQQSTSSALQELARQTGNGIVVGDPYGSFNDALIDLDLTRAPFWAALDAVCRQSGNRPRLQFDQRRAGVAVVAGACGKQPLAYSGPVRAEVTGARRVFIEEIDHEALDSEVTHTFQLNVQLMWEERFRLVAFRSQPEIVAAVTDTGTRLTAVQSAPGDWKTVGAGPRQTSVTLRLHPPPVAARQLDTLHVRWQLIAVGDMAKLDITDFRTPGAHSQDDVRVTLQSIDHRPASRCEVTMVVQRDLQLPDPQGVLLEENSLDLLDAKGQPWKKLIHGWRLTEEGLRIQVAFTPDGDQGEAKTLRFSYPRLRAQHDLDIIFQGVPLPAARPE
jgi:hypothetical protein